MPIAKPHLLRCVSIVMVLACAMTAAADDAHSQSEVATTKDAVRIESVALGFNGYFKVGHWTPIAVTLAGDTAPADSQLRITTPDNDGIPVTLTAPVNDFAYIRAGRIAGTVTIELQSADGTRLAASELSPTNRNSDTRRFLPLPSTGELVLQFGSGELGLEQTFGSSDSDGPVTRGFARIESVAALPTDSFGYDAVDVIILDTTDVEFSEQLAADARRLEALRAWVELGGRLVLLSGRTAPDLVAAGKPFADFAPGTVEPLVRLAQTQSLENYAASKERVGQAGVQQNIPVPLLTSVRGHVDLFGRATDVPLVVRTAKGLGEVTFVAVGLTDPPLSEWSGHTSLLRAILRPYLHSDNDFVAKQKLVSLGYDDLIGALRQRLGSSFAGVAVIGFPIVALLVIGYLLLLGPLDYLFVEKFVRRAWVAWITLPLIILGTAGGAALLLGAKLSEGVRLNRAEVVDFDLTTGRTRGHAWASLYSPTAERFDVSLTPRLPNNSPAANAAARITWFGLPGSGLGGMHAASQPIDVTGVGYDQPADLSQLTGLPILTASSKSLQATWDQSAPAPPSTAAVTMPITAELTLDDDCLPTGPLTNETGGVLKNAYLLAGQWGYQLGDLQPGQQITVSRKFTLTSARTIVTRRAGQDATAAGSTFLADRATSDQLLSVLMFYKASGGEAFTGVPNRYQSDLDLSHLLTQNRAILVAALPPSTKSATGSEWINAATNEPLSTAQDQSMTIYRFILPLNSQPSSLNSPQ